MAKKELRLERFPIHEKFAFRPISSLEFQKVRVLFSVPDTLFVDTFIDRYTGEIVNDFPSDIIIKKLAESLQVKIEVIADHLTVADLAYNNIQ